MNGYLNEMLANAEHEKAMQDFDTPEHDIVQILNEILDLCNEPGILLTDVRQHLTELIEHYQ